MKKTLFAALALAFVASCSNEEVVEMAQKEAIGFDNAFVNNSTRSVSDPSITADNLKDFALYGFVESDKTTDAAFLFDGVTVNKTITNSELSQDWKYENTQYWIKDAIYNFSAVAPLTDAKWEKTFADKTGVKLSFENEGTQDLLYAQSQANIKGVASNNQPVEFTFNHILSKVKFSFKNNYNASASTIRVKDIKITDAYKNGNVELTVNSTSWSRSETNLELNFGMATDNEATTDAKESVEVAYAYNNTYESQNERLLIPNTSENDKDTYKVEFTVDLLVSGTVIKTYNHTATVEFKPEPGKSYDILAVINAENIDPTTSQEPIEFTVTSINEWDNPNGSTTDVDATVNTTPSTGEEESGSEQ